MKRATRRTFDNLVDFMQAIAVVLIAASMVGAFLVGATYWFKTVDCNTARHGLAFLEACAADADCQLRPHDLDLRKAYKRLELKSCPRD